MIYNNTYTNINNLYKAVFNIKYGCWKRNCTHRKIQQQQLQYWALKIKNLLLKQELFTLVTSNSPCPEAAEWVKTTQKRKPK